MLRRFFSVGVAWICIEWYKVRPEPSEVLVDVEFAVWVFLSFIIRFFPIEEGGEHWELIITTINLAICFRFIFEVSLLDNIGCLAGL